jgi:hypothetical protein
MTAPAFHFEAKKYALRQAKDGVIVSFVLHPDDVVPELLSAPIGEHYVVALAPYEKAAEQAEQQPEAPPPSPEKVKERRPFHTLPRSQQAAILINDASFQWWVGSNRNAAETDQMIKAHMGIASKRDLDQDIYAQKWDRMVEEFRVSSGRVTWERPA